MGLPLSSDAWTSQAPMMVGHMLLHQAVLHAASLQARLMGKLRITQPGANEGGRAGESRDASRSAERRPHTATGSYEARVQVIGPVDGFTPELFPSVWSIKASREQRHVHSTLPRIVRPVSYSPCMRHGRAVQRRHQPVGPCRARAGLQSHVAITLLPSMASWEEEVIVRAFTRTRACVCVCVSVCVRADAYML